MEFIARVFRRLEEDGFISRIPVTDDSPPTFDVFGRMIGTCNTCHTETIATCPECRFFRCIGCACSVCAEEVEQ